MMAARSLENKLAIVTGASRGIGEAIAKNLAAKGCNLVLNYTSDSSSDATQSLSAKLVAEHNIRTLVVQADVGSPTGPGTIVEATVNHFSSTGSQRPFQIDILIHNAGIARNNFLSEVKVADFHATYAVNVLGPLLLTQAALPYLPRDRSGRIVSISSITSSLGLITHTVYAGTKGALESMTRTWARELAERCTVNAINPGPVEGPMHAKSPDFFKDNLRPFIEHSPLMRARPERGDEEEARLIADSGVPDRRLSSCAEIAGIVGMLCSEEAGWCTGQVVCANGGMII